MCSKCMILFVCTVCHLFATQVRDFDKFSRHTVLGEVKVPLGQLNISYPLELQEDLQIPQKVQWDIMLSHTHTHTEKSFIFQLS